MSRRRKHTEFWESGAMNNLVYIQYYNRLMELATSMFDWINLPDTVDPRFLELALYRDGHAVFFKDEAGYLALRATLRGPFTVYNIPTSRRAYAVNGYQRELTDKDSVLIYNNTIHTNSMLDTEIFARKLYEIDRAIEINAKAQKTPILLSCDETERLSVLNLYKEFDGNAPVIHGQKGLRSDMLQVVKTDAPYVADKLYTLKTQIWNEALTYLGISNINVQKKERLITDEVMRNQGGTIASRYSRLESRRQACEKINEMFGLNVDVDYREDYREADDELMLTGETGDETRTVMFEDVRTRTRGGNTSDILKR